jgi:hypothetical protein
LGQYHAAARSDLDRLRKGRVVGFAAEAKSVQSIAYGQRSVFTLLVSIVPLTLAVDQNLAAIRELDDHAAHGLSVSFAYLQKANAMPQPVPAGER